MFVLQKSKLDFSKISFVASAKVRWRPWNRKKSNYCHECYESINN